MNKDLKDQLKSIKLLILDVDGVLTRGDIIYDHQGKEFKFFNVYNKSAIDLFIGKYFAMKADVNDINYQKELLVLSNTNSAIFSPSRITKCASPI